MERIVREAECKRLTGLSRTTRWELERHGQFPPRRRLGVNSVGWLESELREWMHGRERRAMGQPTAAVAAARPVSAGSPDPSSAAPRCRRRQAMSGRCIRIEKADLQYGRSRGQDVPVGMAVVLSPGVPSKGEAQAPGSRLPARGRLGRGHVGAL